MRLINKLLNWYFSRNSLPYWCILLLDCIILFCSGVVVFWLFHRGGVNGQVLASVCRTMGLVLLVSMIGFRIFHTYAGVIRFSSFVDLQRVAFANFLSMLVVIGLRYLLEGHTQGYLQLVPTRQIIVIFVVATMLMWLMRVIVKVLYDLAYRDTNALPVFIYGIKDGGVGLAKTIRNEKPNKYILKGFISHDKQFKVDMLMGVRVFDVDDHLPEIIKRREVKAVLISPQRNTEFRNDEKLQEYLVEAGVKIFMTTEATEWKEGDNETTNSTNTSTYHEVSIEDLLPRQQINVDMESVGALLTGKKILITGSAGSIGSEMVRQIAEYRPAEMMLIDQAETPQHDIRLMMADKYPNIKAETVVTSICKKDRMETIFKSFCPDYVFHAAAYKHVPMMENNPCESVQNNIYGTKVIADLSVKYGVKKFVMISTDKAVNPTNVMGCSKRICEIYVQSLNKAENEGKVEGHTQFVTTRFGNVLGSNGSVIPLFRRQIMAGGPVTVTHPNIIRFFMLISEACKLVLEAGTKGKGGEIFVFDMGKPVKIADLAKRMIKMSGVKNVDIVYTGLRAGEKLYEEVLNEEETTKPSFHEKIRIANVREYDFDEVNKQISELIDESLKYDDMKVVGLMNQTVPEYKSKNSIYEYLDKKS